MTTSLDDVQIALLSFRRATTDERFFVLLYRKLSADRIVAELLEAHDMDKRTGLVRHAIACIILYRRQYALGHSRLQEVARMHGPGGLGLTPGHMRLFCDALIETVAECDAKWDHTLGASWHSTLQPALNTLEQMMRRAA